MDAGHPLIALWSLVLRVVLVLDGLVFGQHPLMQNTGNQNAARFLPVKHHMLALLHAPEARSNFITRATERGIVGKELKGAIWGPSSVCKKLTCWQLRLGWLPFTAFLSRLTNHVSPFPALSAFPSRSEKNLFRDRISNHSARRYSGDIDRVVQRKWTNHDVGIGRRYCVGIDVIGNLLSSINKIAVHG